MRSVGRRAVVRGSLAEVGPLLAAAVVVAVVALVVIAGLSASTLLTLLVLPTLYGLLARAGLDQQSRRAPVPEPSDG